MVEGISKVNRYRIILVVGISKVNRIILVVFKPLDMFFLFKFLPCQSKSSRTRSRTYNL